MSNILIIDNDDHYCRDMVYSLEAVGCDTLIAHDQAAALTLAAQYRPKKIILEQQLTNCSAFDLIEPLVTIINDTKLIVLSRSACLADAVKAIKLGAFNYLPKPIDGRTLLQSFATKSEVIDTTQSKYKPMSIKRFEWEYIHTVLANQDGNISAAARELGINRRTLQRKLKKYPSVN